MSQFHSGIFTTIINTQTRTKNVPEYFDKFHKKPRRFLKISSLKKKKLFYLSNHVQTDRILLWAVQSQGQRRSISTELSPDRGRPPHSSERSGGCSTIHEEREVSWSWQHLAELVQAGGEDVITALTTICNKIWQTGEWSAPGTQSLVITLTKKDNLQQWQNYRTISLISKPSKFMLKIILNRMKPQAEKIIAEEQAAFSTGRSTTEQIFNLRILCKQYLQQQQDLYHVFIDFKKASDRVWRAALWATMKHKHQHKPYPRHQKPLWQGH